MGRGDRAPENKLTMGKGDKANRDKGKQASSARAAELLVNQTSSAVLPAVGFGG